jgi:hypothetical protein
MMSSGMTTSQTQEEPVEEGVEERKAREKRARQLRRARTKVSVLLILPRPFLSPSSSALLSSFSCPPLVLPRF